MLQTSQEIIQKVLVAKNPSDIFTSNWLAEYKEMIKLIHPDRCKLPDANKASAKLGEFKALKESGVKYSDDAGSFILFDDKAIFSGSASYQDKVVRAWNVLVNPKTKGSQTFSRYLPAGMVMSNERTAVWPKRAVPLVGLTLPQEHVNWIISRMLELAAWYGNIGQSSLSFTPESVFVVPETHGIVHASFYHMTNIGNRVESISAKYRHWYPKSVFDVKVATKMADVYMIKRFAAYLLGDKSGDGVVLKMRKDINKDFIDFLLTSHQTSFEAFTAYRAMLNKNFDTKKFHKLEI